MGIKNALVFSLLALGDIQLAQQDVAQARENFTHAHELALELQIAYAINEASKRLNSEQLS